MHTALRRSTPPVGRCAILLAALLTSLPGAGRSAPPAEASTAPAAAEGAPWWRHAVIYEIYPRSFQDSNGDGTGDLNGITTRLDYLEQLGVDAIWIAPFYPSPQVDFGYDISDYEGIDPLYGTFADFDRLLAEASRRHIRVLLDMVLNHTSDQHPWFLDSARSRTSPHHDFYVWSDGKLEEGGGHRPPNNWVSLFGGSAWQFVPGVGQFYYHRFYPQQPDLNWRNPQVERQMFGVMRFWLDRGVAGFRLDAVTELFEDARLRDAPALGGVNAQGDLRLSDIYTKNLPEVHEVMRRLRAMVDGYPGERVLIGETYLANTSDLDEWYGGTHHDELQLPMDTLVGLGNRLDAVTFRRHLAESQSELHGSQPLVAFDNHDNVRSWDRFGDGVHDAQIARIVAALLLTTRATALVYQGQEIGQRTATPRRVEQVRDPIGIRGWPREKGRDGERTPMQWDTSNAQAGFSSNPHTWLPVTADYPSINVQRESADPESLLNWYRRLIALRRSNEVLRDGRMVMLDTENPSVLSYARVSARGAAVIICLNMSPRVQTLSLGLAQAGLHGTHLRTLMSSPQPHEEGAASAAQTLPPYAAWIAELR
jgi:alpha-glucosidase